MPGTRLSTVPSLLLCAILTTAAPAQEPLPNAAGFGAVYTDFGLVPILGSSSNHGVAVDPGTGHFLVATSAPFAGIPHQVHRIDGSGSLVGTFVQPAVHTASAVGLRDLDSDGSSILGGSEFGISVFDPTNGALVQQLDSLNGPQPIVQPIAGPVAMQLAVFRAIAFDRAGNGGDGSLLVADLDSPVYEIDLAGNILASWPALGWSARGLVIDPVTGNPWLSADSEGRILELDRLTMAPTGRFLEPIDTGLAGGLAPAGTQAGQHEPWATESAFVHLVEGTEDRVSVRRLHLFPSLRGWDELQLRIGRNGNPLTPALVPFSSGDTLDYQAFDPTGLRSGQPVWIVFNIYNSAAQNGYTDLSSVLPGLGVLIEHRALSPLSQPSIAGLILVPGAIGTTYSWAPPPGFPLLAGGLFRMQGLYLEPASAQAGIASTNQVVWQQNDGERGIVVAAAGTTSFNGGQYPPFWTVTSDRTHYHGTITAVEFSTIGATGPAAAQLFDTDQNNMNDRFDGGNSALAAYAGTYRLGSDTLCGLDYAAPGAYVGPFHLPGESAGVGFSSPPDVFGQVADLRFAFTAFTPGRTFAFDCDTDGGGPNGGAQAGMIVRITTTGSGVLTGVLAVDPTRVDRSVVWFP